MEELESGVTPEEVEEPAEATTADEQEEEIEEPGDDSADEPPKKSKGVQKRIDELVRQREEERARADRLEAAIMQQMQQRHPQEQPAPAPQFPDAPPIPPDRYMYDTDTEYQQAVAQYQQENLAFVQGQIYRVQQEAQGQYQQQQRQQQIAQGLQGLVAKGAAAHPDFQSVAFVPRGLEDVFVASENGAEIAYHLGKNPAELQRITALSPVQAAYEIAKLDAKLSAPKPAATKAPAPINPVGGNTPAEKDPDKMTIEEWMAWRQKQVNQ